MDCRNIHVDDPAIPEGERGSARPHRKHVGTHPDYVRWVCDSPRSRRELQHIFEEIEGWLHYHRLAPPHVPLIIVCFCDWGKHRSVAAGGLISHVLDQDGHWAVSGVHCMQERWLGRASCSRRHDCDLCHRTRGDKSRVYQEAWRMWCTVTDRRHNFW